MDVKPAIAADIPAIAALWHEGWIQGHAAIAPAALAALRTSQEFSTRAKAHLKHTQVAWVDGKMAGFFLIDRDEIYQFYVAKEFQGTGLATELLNKAEASLGHGLKWLACSVGNDRAARFDEKCGWEQAGTIPYEVETEEGPMMVEVWRYEKRLG